MGSLKPVFSLVLRITVLLFVIKAINSTDEYVKDLKKKCSKTKRPFFCVTYRLAKFVQDFDYDGPNNSVVKLVKIKRQEVDTSDLLPHPRYLSDDSEQDKIVKFLKRKLWDFFGSHGIAFEVPSGIQVVQGRSLNEVDSELEEDEDDLSTEDARGHGSKLKEKKIFILSILIVAKLVKILLLANMIFFVLLFIKKIILVTAIVFPSVLSHIKQACQQHHQHAQIIAEEAPSHSSSWFGLRQDLPEKPWQTDRQSYWPFWSS